MRRLFSQVGRIAAGSLRVWLIAGILLRVTRLRDRWHPLAIVYYSSPWPVMAFGFLILCLHARRLRRVHASHRYAFFTVAALFTWLALSWYSTPAAPPLAPEAIRVVAWNVGRPGPARFNQITKWLRSQNADILALAEAQPENTNDVANWRAAFPEYRVEVLEGDMMCLVRGEVHLIQQGDLGHVSFYALSKAVVRNEEFTLLQADIYAHPRWPRREPLQQLANIASAHRDEKLLVLGDLNTPRESVAFDPFRSFLVHCFEETGSGLAETWPTWCPALSLDHVWVSASTHPRNTRIGWPLWSDHRPVIVEFGP